MSAKLANVRCAPEAFELLTIRLRLRAVEMSDLEAMVDMWTAPDVPGFMDDFGPRSREEAVGMLPAWMDVNVKDTDVYLCHFELRATFEVVGYLGWGPSDGGVADVNLAYVVRPSFRNHGYASEALAGMLNFCFDDGVPSVWGSCHHDNPASARVMEKAGMHALGLHESELRFIAHAATWRSPRNPDATST